MKIPECKYKVGDIRIRKWDPIEIILKDDLGEGRFNAHEVGHPERTWSGIHSSTLDLHFDLKKTPSKYKAHDKLQNKKNGNTIVLVKENEDGSFQARLLHSEKILWTKLTEKQLDKDFTLDEEKTPDNVNQPKHYTQGGIETIDFIEAKLTREEVIGAYKFNIIKYGTRSHLKNGEEDLRKMHYYSDRLIKFLEKK